MNRFVVGGVYSVLRLDNKPESVVVANRDQETVTLEDGRKTLVLYGVSPDDSSEEVLRLGEVGPVATGGVIRACHLQSKPDQETGAAIDAARKGQG